jgi:hypothetical protein
MVISTAMNIRRSGDRNRNLRNFYARSGAAIGGRRKFRESHALGNDEYCNKYYALGLSSVRLTLGPV